jgi:hypothetical protein
MRPPSDCGSARQHRSTSWPCISQRHMRSVTGRMRQRKLPREPLVRMRPALPRISGSGMRCNPVHFETDHLAPIIFPVSAYWRDSVSRRVLIMPDTINILWTGGWDSSFQLIRCYIHGTASIQPVYLIDEGRRSTAMELLTMMRIKEALRAQFPERAESLLPIRFCAVSDLLSDPKITSAYKRIHKRARIGIQYDWLARFCDQFGVPDLQLCIHKDDRAHAALQNVVEYGGVNGYRVNEENSATDEYELFRFYNFPIFDMSKLDIQEHAEEMGFSPIMNLTWFCQAPKDGKPCGSCLPCRFTVEEGLGWRVPYLRRLYGALLWTILRPAKVSLKSLSTGSTR